VAGLTFKIEGRRFNRDLSRVERRLGNLRPFFAQVGELVVASVQRNFEVGGRPQKWPPVKAATIRGQWLRGNAARKRKRQIRGQTGGFTAGYKRFAAGKKTLIRTGRLLRSIHFRATGRHVMVGTRVKYAAVHNFGGKTGRGGKTTIPQRRFLMLQREDKTEIQATLTRFIGGGT